MILRGADAVSSPSAGGKARALARAELAGLRMPAWFVLSSGAFAASLDPAQRAALERAENGAGTPLAQALASLTLTPSLAESIDEAVCSIARDGALLAVRSSASDEDGVEHSFAGQLESFLNVPRCDVTARVADVWRSGFTERILAYRREHRLSGWPHAPAVLVQRMIAARAAGVAFAVDPVSGRSAHAVVSAVHGLGSAIVSGEVDADTWAVDHHGVIVEPRPASTRQMHVADTHAPAGVRLVNVPPELAERPPLTDDEVVAVAQLARAASRHFGRPQDIEWAIDDAALYLLQSRPITSLRSLADPDARLVIWDNSNIVESYSGVTTPLTFSFAAFIYEHVYRQFCRMMGVPSRVVDAEHDTFANMLGLVRGRLFYNLLNWYRVLAMLPGYRLNTRFMEQMMGVKEPLPEGLVQGIETGIGRGRALDALYAVRTVGRLVWNHFTLDRRVDAFYARLDHALDAPDPALEDRRLDELTAHYGDLRQRLLLCWDAPIVNDFFAMVFYGLLRSLVMRWCSDPDGTLQNDLICGNGGIVSAEPAIRMQRMAMMAAGDAALVSVLQRGTLAEARAAASAHGSLAAEIDAYLAKFGDRTINELKLESITFHDDPLPLYRAIGTLAAQASQLAARAPRPSDEDQISADSAADRLRAATRTRVRVALSAHPFRRLVFGWVLRNATRRVRDRENLRLERTRLFARVRRIFLEIGHRLTALDLLDEARDVFYLEVDEALAFVDGRATTTNLKGLAALRKAEFSRYAEEPPPADRFETRGAVYQGHDFRPSPSRSSRSTKRDDATETGSDSMKGLGCCPGTVRGPVRIVRDPTTVDLEQRVILVAEHTDPGWIMVFPSARGVLVERGSLLSHAAIVARELGIPAVVSLPGVTRWLRDNDWVEMDGTTGLVRKIEAPAETNA